MILPASSFYQRVGIGTLEILHNTIQYQYSLNDTKS